MSIETLATAEVESLRAIVMELTLTLTLTLRRGGVATCHSDGAAASAPRGAQGRLVEAVPAGPLSRELTVSE